MGAQTGLFDTTAAGDWGGAWLSFLFGRGEAVSGGVLETLAQAFREGLGVYTVAMFTLGGFFLIWQVVAMIAETAHSGVPFGRRTNQLWAPLRFVIGIALLVPFGSGLSMGQHMVVAMAAKGSSLASEAWRETMALSGGRLTTPVAPASPDVARVVAGSLEVELCRAMYRQLYTQHKSDLVVQAAGDMAVPAKLPSVKLGQATWLYTTSFLSDAAVCGAYRFASSEAVGETSQGIAQRLGVSNAALAEKVAPSFLLPETDDSTLYDPSYDLTASLKEQVELVETQVDQATAKYASGQALYAANADRGWIVAGALPLDVARLQMMLGESVASVVPSVKAPLLGHSVLSFRDWLAAATGSAFFHDLTGSQLSAYGLIYDKASEGMKRARRWLYSHAPQQAGFGLPDQQDARDSLNTYADFESAYDTLSRTMAKGSRAFGVFAIQPQLDEERGGAVASVLLGRSYLTSPLQTFAELGRRFMAYGAWAIGMLGPVLAQGATVGIGIGFYLGALAFIVAGVALLFLVPLVPLYRFGMAVIGWGLSVLIALFSLPIVALGHLYPAGDGLAGPLARRAYWLWLGLFIRPSLILFAFAGGLLLFLLGGGFLNMLFFQWLAPALQAQGDGFWLFRSGMALLYAASVFALSNAVFKGLSTAPSEVMDWIGAQSFMPESAAPAQPVGQAGTAGETLLALEQQGRETLSRLVSTTRSGERPARTGRERERNLDPVAAAAQRQSAHFPALPEEKAAQRAEAYAAAQAHVGQQGGGGVTAQAAARAGLAASEAHAMVVGKQMPQGGDEALMSHVTSRLLAPDDHGKPEEGEGAGKGPRSGEKQEGDKEGKPKSPSIEQSADPVDPLNNPFKPE